MSETIHRWSAMDLFVGLVRALGGWPGAWGSTVPSLRLHHALELPAFTRSPAAERVSSASLPG